MSKNISKKQLRQFGLLLGFGFPILFGLVLPSIHGHQFKIWTLWIGIPNLSLSLIRPYFLRYPYEIWMKLGYILGWFNSRLILGLIFLIVLQPIALVMKLFKYDPLRKKKSKNKSYRENKVGHEIDLKKIF